MEVDLRSANERVTKRDVIIVIVDIKKDEETKIIISVDLVSQWKHREYVLIFFLLLPCIFTHFRNIC